MNYWKASRKRRDDRPRSSEKWVSVRRVSELDGSDQTVISVREPREEFPSGTL